MRKLDHCLDYAGELQTAGRDTGDPSKTAKPAYNIRERFLKWPWSEFTDEVVLACECQFANKVRKTEMPTSRGGRHRGKLSPGRGQ